MSLHHLEPERIGFQETENYLARFSIQLNCKWVDLRLFSMILNDGIA